MGLKLSIDAVEEMLIPPPGMRITPVLFTALFCGAFLVLKLIIQDIILFVMKRRSNYLEVEEGEGSSNDAALPMSTFALVQKMQDDKNSIFTFLIVLIPYLIYSQSSYFNYT